MNFTLGTFPFLTNRKTHAAPLKLSHTEPDAIHKLSEKLAGVFASVHPLRPIVAVCVGTDRSTGDALGPLVGSSLKKNAAIPVYGTLDEPVHAVNLAERLEAIYEEHRNPYILAVDACLGQLSSVGNIHAGEGPVKPGAGVNKELPPVGDYHVTGIVNVGGFMEYFVLQNTRLSLVFNMAEVISESIRLASELHLSALRASGSGD